MIPATALLCSASSLDILPHLTQRPQQSIKARGSLLRVTPHVIESLVSLEKSIEALLCLKHLQKILAVVGGL
jgi:hypothetical protein